MPSILKAPGAIKKYAVYLAISWTAVIGISAAWNIYQTHSETTEKARTVVRTYFELNLMYRRWSSMLGGLYAPADKVQPNPYLHVPERDVQTTNGRHLTLVNPAYMTRLVFDLMRRESTLSIINHVVSLKNLNPANKPDPWEEKALLEFERGEKEISGLMTMNGETYMRIIKPFVTEKDCLKCHGFQGYKIGDIRGGLSISVPMKPFYESEIRTRNIVVLTHLFLWLVGVCGIVLLSQKIRRQQEKVEENVEKLRILSESASDWEYWVDENREVVFMSPSCEGVTGYAREEFLYNPDLGIDIIYPDDKEAFRKHLEEFRSREHQEIEFRILTKSGEIKWLSHRCGPIYVGERFLGRRVTCADITDKRRLEEQLIQSQKMESLGLLAGGIAHDFNNLLTVIMGYSSLLRNEVHNKSEKLVKYITHVLNASERAQNLTSSLLTFSRKQIIKPQIMSLNSVVKSVSNLLKPIISEDIEVRLKCADVEFPVFADPSQMEQVIMNLATNAKDAMPEGGILEIETVALILDAEYTEKYNANPGQYMMLAVSDSGCGIEKEYLTHIFDPFFTTKEKGKGTGLGLAMVYGIVKQHEGFVNVYSEQGIGTTFKVYIPAVPRDYRDEERARAVVSQTGTDYRGDETVLVAEDEEIVREFLKDVLERYGYTVILAEDGEAAIRKYREFRDRIDGVLLDVIMPKKNGKEAYDSIRKTNPQIKVLFMSGYTKDIVTSKGVYEEGLEFIRKPLEIQELLSHLRTILKPA